MSNGIKTEEIVSTLDYIYPNTFEYKDKEKWIKELECRIEEEIINTHEKEVKGSEFLYAPKQYEDMYVLYLQAQIDSGNNEYDRYSNHIALFYEKYSEFESWYNRNNMPVSHGQFGM